MTAPGDDANSFCAPSFQWRDEAESPELAALLAQEIAVRHGSRDEKPLFIHARDADGALICGVNGMTHWRWLYVRHFWVAPARRAQGLGTALMAEVERAARERGCVGVYLDTFDEGPARFYERLGFRRCGRIENFPPRATRTILAKPL
jgi:GNAT superfamily N-acetyltransferase